MNNDIKKVQPMDSFTVIYKILVWAGFYKPLNKPSSRLKQIFYEIYRFLALLYTIVYNVQHLIFTAQHLDDIDKLIDGLVIELPQINLFAKVLTMFVQTPRIDRINELLNGPIFAATDEKDEMILQKNTIYINRMSKMFMIAVFICSFFWTGSFFLRRYTDKNVMVNSYMPFETETWAGFSLSVCIECGSALWTGYGHVIIDCLIAAYYAQARTQIKIIKHQLQVLDKTDEKYEEHSYLKSNFQYKDLTDETILKRFIKIVKRYEKLIWYNKEINATFNFSLSVQFLSSASAVCFVIYRVTSVNVSSFLFIFMTLLFFLLLSQVFLYCFYGNLVEKESHSLNDSLYKSDWLSLSPPFRRSLLIAMCRWSQPIRPKVCGVISVSLDTFVSIVKSSYTLYTVLVITANANRNDI